MSKVHIHTLLNPVTRETAYTTVEAGKPLSAHLNVPDDVLITRNGKGYRDGILHDGDVLSLVKVPKGGENSKAIGRTAIVIGATLLASALTGPLGLGAVGSSLFIGGVQAAASFGAAKLIPPQLDAGAALGDNAQFQRMGSLTGTRNRVNPYGAVPKVYGKRKVFPVMSANPYTEIVNNDQFLNMLFMVTTGPGQLSIPKIGDTIIGSFDSDNQFTSNGNFTDIQIDVGESPDLYSNTVSENSVGVNLDGLNDSTVRTTEPDTERISCDFVFPQGLFALTETGNTAEARVSFKIEIRETGTSTWHNVESDGIPGFSVFGQFFSNFAYLGDGTYAANNKARETFRTGFSTEVDKGQYDIRVTRLTAEGEGVDQEYPQVFDSCQWSVIRSSTYEKPTNMEGVVQLAMRIKATDQLTGVLDNFSVVCESRLATYDGSSWDEPTFDASNGTGSGGALTSNPAWIMADLLTGDATARTIDKNRLSAASFKGWADNCNTESRECNLVIDRSQTVLQTASAIGSTGRGSLALIDGVYKIIQDTEQSTPVQHFTRRNIIKDTFSSTRTFPDIPHALRVNFVNPDADWETDEATVYDDGYSEDGTNCQFDDGTGVCKEATEFETVDLQGVTSWDQAWKEGRYRLAESRLRPERYTWQADVENIICNRGDMVRVSHDVTLWGQISGRIKSISGSTLTLDEEVTMEAGESYNIRVRTQSGGSEVKSVTTNAGTTNTITVDSTSNISKGDLFMFGEVGTETQELKILSIEPRGDLTARITAVDAAPDIYDADTGSIPDFDSNITTPVDPEETFNQAPPSPTIVNVRSDVNVLNRDPNGIPELRIVTSYTLGTGSPTQFIDGRFKKQGDGQNNWTSFGTVEASAGSVWLYNVEAGDTYIIQIRARSGDKASDWVEADPHEAGANITIPPRERLKAIGVLLEDVSSEVSEVGVELDGAIRSGWEYWIVNENELSLSDRFAGIYPVMPLEVGGETTYYGPGKLDGTDQSKLDIDSQYINAPEGSLIFLAPGQENENIKYPDFSFVSDTLEVAADTLRSSMDLIAQGVNFAKPNVSAVDVATGDILLSGTTGDLDDISDGTNYKRVASIAVTAQGIVLMEQISGDLDDVEDGSSYRRTNATQLTAQGLVVLSVAEGDIDDIDDGTNFAKVKATSVSAGEILLVEAVGDLDDLADGSNFQRVASTQLTAGGIVLLSVVNGDLDDVDDGDNFGKVNIINIDAGTGRITLVEALGDLDDIDDGGTFQKVRSASLNASGLVIVSGLEGDLDDLDDGGTYAKVLATEVSAGHIKIVGPDGQTVIDQGEIDTDALVVGNTVFIGNSLSSLESGSSRVLIGNANDQSLPYVRAQYNSSNYVQMVGAGSSGKFFRAVSNGNEVLSIDSNGLTIGNNSSIVLSGSAVIRDGGSDIFMDSSGLQIRAGTSNVNKISFIPSSTGFTNEADIYFDNSSLILTSDSGNDIEVNPGNDCRFSTFTGGLYLLGLPTSDPGNAGQIWDDGGTLKRS